MEVGTYVPLELNYFDSDKLEMLIKQHQYKEGGLSLVNVVTLHKALQTELNMVANNNIPIAQKNEINEVSTPPVEAKTKLFQMQCRGQNCFTKMLHFYLAGVLLK